MDYEAVIERPDPNNSQKVCSKQNTESYLHPKETHLRVERDH